MYSENKINYCLNKNTTFAIIVLNISFSPPSIFFLGGDENFEIKYLCFFLRRIELILPRGKNRREKTPNPHSSVIP
jgi:hypothetical protein